jgi:hypothetical protein
LPRPLSEYNALDWLRLRPILHRLKQARYDRITQRYLRLPVRTGDLTTLVRTLAGRRVMVTVAYEDPTAIEWHCRLIRLFVPTPLHVIADNSHDDAAARAIAAVAAREGRPYLRLPENPWAGPGASRSHGLALNWLWSNLIRTGAPEAFGFLDHDLFPTAPDDPFAPLARQPFFGAVRPAGKRWFLWAGFCFFHFAAVRDLPLDFGQDWFAGLDTGGANWQLLYRDADRARMKLQEFRAEPALTGVPLEDSALQWTGVWLHEYGTQARADLAPRKRARITEILMPLLEETPRTQRTGSTRSDTARSIPR